MSATSQPVRIESLSTDWPSVLQQSLAPPPGNPRLEAGIRRCWSLLLTGSIDPHGIWIAVAGERIVGMQVCVPLPGAACFFWLPVAEMDMVDRLVQASVDWARS